MHSFNALYTYPECNTQFRRLNYEKNEREEREGKERKRGGREREKEKEREREKEREGEREHVESTSLTDTIYASKLLFVR